MDYKYIIKQFLPPIIANATKNLLLKDKLPEREYTPSGWSAKNKIRGWDHQSIVDAQRKRWPAFVRSLEGTTPLTVETEVSPELVKQDLRAHNRSMCFGYVLALASREKQELSILDWGGGAGHFYLVSKALLSNAKIHYTCFDTPPLCNLGKELLPEVDFSDNPDYIFKKKYDLVFVSGSLQYFENWQEILHKLAKTTRGYLYLTRLRIINKAPSYVTLQRAFETEEYGYDTEYYGWVLNRQEFLKNVERTGMRLVREFYLGQASWVFNAPEQSESLGFLFVPNLHSIIL
jgi:putative methyltransferase (TIGR04325 family)